ncbi:MAG: carboxypeptidase regulatory-like domain-containing protein [Acidobacteria bacterium]|nr:carboxypeptidase regulatory-like domain-containing protein [Acidobacteriota bacterium]
MKSLSLALICITPCAAQQTALNFSGVISGTLRGEDGTAIVGGYVSMALRPPHPKRLRQTDWTAVTRAGGVFQFRGLNDGQYSLCAQVPGSTFLNPCEWGLQPVQVGLSPAQPIATVTIAMKRGAAVPIRMEDPGELLSQHEGRTPGAHVLIGVGNDGFAFLPAPVVSRDRTGRDHQVVIPFNSLVKLVVHSSFFQLSDAAGIALPKGRTTSIPLTVPAGQQPPAIRLRVTGAGR